MILGFYSSFPGTLRILQRFRYVWMRLLALGFKGQGSDLVEGSAFCKGFRFVWMFLLALGFWSHGLHFVEGFACRKGTTFNEQQ